jgi:hypothetical protein
MLVPTRCQSSDALAQLPKPGGSQLKFLREHAKSRGRALTARRLAEAVGYRNHGGINLQYGLLARRIGEVLGRRDPHLSILVDFVPPRSVTNREWVMVMHPQFAEALKDANWI